MKVSGKEVIQKKLKLILNKLLLHITILLISFSLFGQDKKENVWKSEKDYLEYRKKDKYKGPDDWSGSYPSDLIEEDYVSTNSGSSSGGLKYNPQQIQQDRKKRLGGFDRGGGEGDVQFDPTVERPDPIEIPDIDPPDIDGPDIDLPDINLPTISQSVWKVLLFILVFAVVFTLAYLIIKNRKPSDKKVIIDVDDEWNPEVISKTELELRLEAAIEKEDYRECIRIYFTFILKELIRKSWINWKKEKTNHHYFIELSSSSTKQGDTNAMSFGECIRIYDLVWYGDYKIDRDIYELLKPTLENYYQSLEPVNE